MQAIRFAQKLIFTLNSFFPSIILFLQIKLDLKKHSCSEAQCSHSSSFSYSLMFSSPSHTYNYQLILNSVLDIYIFFYVAKEINMSIYKLNYACYFFKGSSVILQSLRALSVLADAPG